MLGVCSPRVATVLSVLALAALGLVACGGSDDEPEARADGGSAAAEESTGVEPSEQLSDEPSDEDQVEAVISALLIDPDSELICTEVLSKSLLRTAYGDLQGCLNGRQQVTLAESLEQVGGLEVDGDTAVARVTPVGGIYDRLELDVKAVRTDDGWQIDQFTADVPVGP